MIITLSNKFTFTDWREGIQTYVDEMRTGEGTIYNDAKINFGEIAFRKISEEQGYVAYGTSPPLDISFAEIPEEQTLRIVGDVHSVLFENTLLRFAINEAMHRLIIHFPERYGMYDGNKLESADVVLWKDEAGDLHAWGKDLTPRDVVMRHIRSNLEALRLYETAQATASIQS